MAQTYLQRRFGEALTGWIIGGVFAAFGLLIVCAIAVHNSQNKEKAPDGAKSSQVRWEDPQA